MSDYVKAKKMSLKTRKLRATLFAWSFILIPLLYLIANWVFVRGQTVLLAFKDEWNEWSVEHFIEVWTRFTDPYEATMTPIFLNTLLYFGFAEFVGVPFSLMISFFIYKKIAGYKAFRVIFYLPSILPAMVMVIAYSQFLYPGGALETICASIGIHLPEEGLLFNADTAKYALIAYNFLTQACGNILFYSAMSRIPPEIIEAGQIDGISIFKEFIHIVFPLIMPTFSMLLLIDCTKILTYGPPILLFGSPSGTASIDYWFFMQVYKGGVNALGKYGYMSALGLCFTLVNLPIVLFVRWLAEKFSTVEY